MDYQSFIESGLLEAYVLGQCSAEERAEVVRMAAAHPEVQAELEAIELALEKLALANAVPPPPGLKDTVLQKIQDHLPPYSGSLGQDAGPRLHWKAWMGWAAAAGLLLAFTVELYRSNEAANRHTAEIAALKTQVQDCQTQVLEQAKLQDVIALYQNPTTRNVVLADLQNPQITAGVLHNPGLNRTALDINSLPKPEPGTYFQLWAIVKGKAEPQSLGMVNLDEDWQTLPYLEEVQAFAISVEDKPEGNPTPTTVLMVGPV